MVMMMIVVEIEMMFEETHKGVRLLLGQHNSEYACQQVLWGSNGLDVLFGLLVKNSKTIVRINCTFLNLKPFKTSLF